uniref:Chromosome 1 open reading frame 131 n=1 Tax=Gallus gallus TaxID=9031 RepID=A0A8V0XYU7_CHICK
REHGRPSPRPPGRSSRRRRHGSASAAAPRRAPFGRPTPSLRRPWPHAAPARLPGALRRARGRAGAPRRGRRHLSGDGSRPGPSGLPLRAPWGRGSPAGGWRRCSTPSTIWTRTVTEKKNVNKQEFNFEKARLEVHRFGITGYEKQEQRIWERERAIMLGAKPPRKEHINYKKYQEKMKVNKTTKDDDKGQVHKGDSLKKKKKDLKERKAKRKRSVPSIWPAGQVGKFRDGTLILQSGDIKKIKSTKVIK